MNIVLIGYRGAGKSSVAKLLAQRLTWPVVSTDAEIIKQVGMPVTEIIHHHGWDYFRNVESEICRWVGAKDQTIIDTGGGAILRKENIEALCHHSRVFWLTAEVATITERIKGGTDRPSLTGTKTAAQEVTDVLTERLPFYQAACDHVIPTDGRSLDDIADEILHLAVTRSTRI